ncbi:MAG: 5-oxoprolinase subunit PxpA [Armatimonadota bacterium]|nr:5-oxoprolinase subunit PxpA [Armatimonadota bacterium]MDR7460376.1 5-oxoprolinase subunit PxpA [Armatimonadota bacterium]MDR7480538.1 5-oxoprolinase subunit PxpA [Armatimonadota bacterium]MDR7489161.1 5-oxoprolinase subunit PxpA [Armatimonadota bacterium]MDR7491002.1 5-oxoprolinase subunit PxpA [Armatimonadota bacterium]
MERVDLNADVGSGYGRWTLGDEGALLPYVTSANVSCGFHAGDPQLMRRTVLQALRAGVRVGAHVGLPDLLGYGLREMRVTPAEVRDYVLYQAGALAAFLRAAGGRLQHVKPHGALYHMAARDPAIARGLAEGIADLDPRCALVLHGEVAAAAARALEIPFVPEGFVDLDYGADGAPLPTPREVRLAVTPAEAAARAVRLVRDGVVVTRDGVERPLSVRTLGLHADGPASPALARAVREALEGAGVRLVPLGEL